MPRAIKITRISVTHFEWHIPDLGKEEKLGFDAVYQPGSRFSAGGAILTVETDAGVKGRCRAGSTRARRSTSSAATRWSATSSGTTSSGRSGGG
ncbi:MAG TPA: hypothetical protein VFN74_24400 [Chloroflexota bacterium]|nr:hypothetical protein [Chloroflexota bacterium]